MATFGIEQDSAQGRALQATVQVKLREYLGEQYNDDVLPLYIVVMLAHGNNEPLVASNLVEFLQEGPAAQFAAWYAQIGGTSAFSQGHCAQSNQPAVTLLV